MIRDCKLQNGKRKKKVDVSVCLCMVLCNLLFVQCFVVMDCVRNFVGFLGWIIVKLKQFWRNIMGHDMR